MPYKLYTESNLKKQFVLISEGIKTLRLAQKSETDIKLFISNIEKWKKVKYGDKFDSNNISFFIEKDYNEDLTNTDQPNKIMKSK